MGTGILSALNRNGAITPLIKSIDRIKRILKGDFSFNDNQDVCLPIQDYHGVLSSVSHLTETQKKFIANRRNYQTRSEIALDVASAYPGGDYFEFGSSSLSTFCSFLAAFQIYSSHTNQFTSTRFYAFDIFGDPDQGSGSPSGENDYFEAHRQSREIAAPYSKLESYSDLKDRCILVPGYFQDTLNEELKSKMRANNQKIGFAFLDVNTAASYKLVFDFLLDVISSEKLFIYIDEYFMDPHNALLYQMFVDEAKKRYGLHSLYMRNAGNFGALFCLMPPPIALYDSFFPNGERLR